ncbi:MAG: UxaA family hydrolase, partial [Bacteroidales bacterium]|nr:UxaA family hydrolase [Bacteroidales bacterium]
MPQNHSVIIIDGEDNVGIVAGPDGLVKKAIIDDGIMASQDIPMGHKVALKTIKRGEGVIRYGQVIGFAREKILPGDWVQESKIIIPEPCDLGTIPLSTNRLPEMKPLDGYTFQGYRNRDGSVGTKNVLGLTTSVQCVAGFTQFIADKIRRELLPAYPNVDEVVALNHTYGCGVAIDAPAAVIPIRTIRNIASNPNFGGEVLVIGLGCEKLIP